MAESAGYFKSMFGLDGQTAVVIGGGGTLGGAFCRGLAQAGAHVIVASRNGELCQQRVDELKNLGGDASFTTVDVTSRESIQNLLDSAVKSHSRVDILVNSAGTNVASSFFEATDEAWDQIMAINLRGIFQACQIFGKHMVEAGGGAIINVGSMSSLLPLSRVYAYSASKAAVLNLTRNIAQEFAEQDVRVNCICPGFFPTKLNRKVLTKERVESIMARTPMKRFGEPDELVGALLLLASPTAGRFMTGVSIEVDGGFTAAWM